MIPEEGSILCEKPGICKYSVYHDLSDYIELITSIVLSTEPILTQGATQSHFPLYPFCLSSHIFLYIRNNWMFSSVMSNRDQTIGQREYMSVLSQ